MMEGDNNKENDPPFPKTFSGPNTSSSTNRAVHKEEYDENICLRRYKFANLRASAIKTDTEESGGGSGGGGATGDDGLGGNSLDDRLDGQAINEWTVIYSDSNSSIISACHSDKSETKLAEIVGDFAEEATVISEKNSEIDASNIDNESASIFDDQIDSIGLDGTETPMPMIVPSIIIRHYSDLNRTSATNKPQQQQAESQESSSSSSVVPTAPLFYPVATNSDFSEIDIITEDDDYDDDGINHRTAEGHSPRTLTGVGSAGGSGGYCPINDSDEEEEAIALFETITDEDDEDDDQDDDEDGDEEDEEPFSVMTDDRESLVSLSSIVSQASNLSLIREQYLKNHRLQKRQKCQNRKQFNQFYGDEDDEDDDDEDEDYSDGHQPLNPGESSRNSRIRNRGRHSYDHHRSHPQSVSGDVTPYSQFSSASLSAAQRRIRAYVHRRNVVLNGKLNLIMILSLTAVVGLALGHFLGWSNFQWRLAQRQLSLGQVMKLKQLQDDLLLCMHKQQNEYDFAGPEPVGPDPFRPENSDTPTADVSSSNDGQANIQHHQTNWDKVCHQDYYYWRKRFETLFSENKGMIELFQKTQRHFHENGDRANVIGEHECDNKTASEEFHNLKLDLLVKQLEHLKLLDVLEVIEVLVEENQGGQQKLRVLTEENSDLKKKLVEEEADDLEIVETYGTRVAILENENEELRKTIEVDEIEDQQIENKLQQTIDQLMGENGELKLILQKLDKQLNVEDESVEAHSTATQQHTPDADSSSNSDARMPSLFPTANIPVEISAQYNVLHQRINQMMVENEELKTKIALYRWTYANPDYSSSPDDSRREDANTPTTTATTTTTINSPPKDAENIQPDHDQLMQVYQAKIKVLQHQLQLEQNESKRWKQRSELLAKKNKKLKTEKSRKRNSKSSSFSKNDDDEGHHHEEQQSSNQKDGPRESGEKFFEKSAKFFKASSSKWKDTLSKSSGKLWNSLADQWKQSWKSLKSESNEREFKRHKVLVGKFFENALENVHNFSEKLLYQGITHSEQLVQYFSKRLNEISIMLDPTKQGPAKNRPTKQGQDHEDDDNDKSEKSEKARKKSKILDDDDENDDDHDDQEEERFVYPQRGDSWRNTPDRNQEEKSELNNNNRAENWVSRRAKAREQMRRTGAVIKDEL